MAASTKSNQRHKRQADMLKHNDPFCSRLSDTSCGSTECLKRPTCSTTPNSTEVLAFQNLPGALNSRTPPPSPLLALPGALLQMPVFRLTLLALSLRARICAKAASLLIGVPGTFWGAGLNTSSSSRPRTGTIVVVVWAWTVRGTGRAGVLAAGVIGKGDALGDLVVADLGVGVVDAFRPVGVFERIGLVGGVDEGRGESGTTRIGDCKVMMPIAVDGRGNWGLGDERPKRSRFDSALCSDCKLAALE
jgi:hypothetical protein